MEYWSVGVLEQWRIEFWGFGMRIAYIPRILQLEVSRSFALFFTPKTPSTIEKLSFFGLLGDGSKSKLSATLWPELPVLVL